jgi:hypothetical protein
VKVRGHIHAQAVLLLGEGPQYALKSGQLDPR